jgi:2',3'-cyclic-nucleotide 2'-phosphodiesterase (5'-nucleotidase family)
MSDPPVSAARGPRLRVVAVNDVYSLENLPRLRALVQHHAVTDPADVFLATLAGDFVSPSMLSSLDFGRGMIDCLNAFPITHVIFGNHEDDIPTAELSCRVREFRGTWLDTNVPGFDPPLPAFQVVEVAPPGGRRVRVGLLGVVMTDETVYRRPPFGGHPVEEANVAALREAAHLLREEGCACVIPLTHQPIADDRALAAAQREPPFPVILGGHEHVAFLEQVAGTWIVKATADAVDAVVIDLAWPAEAPSLPGAPDLPRVSARLLAVRDYPEDAGLRARVDAHMGAVRALEAATLLKVAGGEELSSIGARARQTSVGRLFCSRLRDALGAEGCLLNGGGIRAARAYHGHFTYGDLEAELPFDNEMVVASLPGKVLREAVAASRAHAPAESGGFLQVDDRMTVEEPGHALVAVAGAPLADDRVYRIAVMRELLRGMDHIEPLVRFAQELPARVPPAGSGRDVKLVLVQALCLSLWRQLGPFDAIDTDHDGAIDAGELAAAVARFTAEPASDLTVELILSAVDADHDHRISRHEAEPASGEGGDEPG